MRAAGSSRPIFPSPPGLGSVGLITGGSSGNFSVRQRFVFTQLHRRQLDTRIARQIHRQPNNVDYRPRDRSESVPSHQYNVVLFEAARQIAALGGVGNEKIGITKVIGDIPDGNMSSNEASGVDDRPKRNIADSEGQTVFGVGVYNSLNVWPRFIDAGVNKSLDGWGAGIADRLAIQRKLNEIAMLDDLWRGEHMRHEKPVW